VCPPRRHLHLLRYKVTAMRTGVPEPHWSCGPIGIGVVRKYEPPVESLTGLRPPYGHRRKSNKVKFWAQLPSKAINLAGPYSGASLAKLYVLIFE